MAATGFLNPSHVVYALSTEGTTHRYVGFTTKKIRQRLAMHRWEAKHGNPAPLYDWFREEGPDDVIATVLEKVSVDAARDQLGEREKFWIGQLRAEGYELINRADGGPGMPGVKKTPEQRAAISERVKRQDISHLWTPENKAKSIAGRVGIKHKPHVFKDIRTQVESGAKAAHNRWHVARGVVKPECALCKN